MGATYLQGKPFLWIADHLNISVIGVVETNGLKLNVLVEMISIFVMFSNVHLASLSICIKIDQFIFQFGKMLIVNFFYIPLTSY